MAGIDTGGTAGRRGVNQDINMIPFIDLLMVTIAFLLITAVWVSHSRINMNAQIPSNPPDEVVPKTPSKDLHVFMNDNDFVLTWKQGNTVVSETRVPRSLIAVGEGVAYDDLAEQIAAEWKRHGSHGDSADREVDRCVFHSDNQVPFRDIVAVMDAVYSTKRDMVFGDGSRHTVSAFNMAFSST